MSTQSDKFNVLAAQIQAVCPIIGANLDTSGPTPVFIPTYDPTATDAQKQAATSVITAFNWNANLPIDTAVNFLRTYANLQPTGTQQDNFNRAVLQALKYLNQQLS